MFSKERYWEIDYLRGIAVLGMIIYHVFYLLNFYNIIPFAMYDGIFLILVRSIQFLFLSLVGIGLVISYQRYQFHEKSIVPFLLKQWNRAIILFLIGMGITLITYRILPNGYVRFGILHLIGTSIFLLSFVVFNRILPCILLLGVLFLSITKPSLPIGDLGLYILGLYPVQIYAIDYFPIIPWMSFILVGIILGQLFFREGKLTKTLPKWNLVLNLKIHSLGKNALIIYLIHVPVILSVFWFLGLMN